MMKDFLEKGVTRQIQFQEGRARYELANKKHHHHLICNSCGRIEEVEGDLLENMELDIKKKKGFKVQSHALEFFGLCKNCQY
jgi:Fur family ferric uptake transcriptional regulator